MDLGNYFCARPSSTKSFLPFLKVSIACAPGFEIDAFKCSLLIQTLDVVSNKYRRSVVGTGFAGHPVQLKLVSEEGMVQAHVVDNSVGATDSVVAGSDWWNRRQLSTSVASDRFGRVDYSTDHRSASRGLADATVSRR